MKTAHERDATGAPATPPVPTSHATSAMPPPPAAMEGANAASVPAGMPVAAVSMISGGVKRFHGNPVWSPFTYRCRPSLNAVYMRPLPSTAVTAPLGSRLVPVGALYTAASRHVTDGSATDAVAGDTTPTASYT